MATSVIPQLRNEAGDCISWGLIKDGDFVNLVTRSKVFGESDILGFYRGFSPRGDVPKAKYLCLEIPTRIDGDSYCQGGIQKYAIEDIEHMQIMARRDSTAGRILFNAIGRLRVERDRLREGVRSAQRELADL